MSGDYCFQTSRETISRLADYAEVAQYNTQDQLERIHKQLIDERSRAEESEKKLHQFQVLFPCLGSRLPPPPPHANTVKALIRGHLNATAKVSPHRRCPLVRGTFTC